MIKNLDARIIGKGYAFPSKIRYNDDPIFSRIVDDGLFKGYNTRRVLMEGECISEYMTVASFNAIADAGIPKNEIDFYIGYGSISEFRAPNVMAKCHNELGLASHCSIIPINDEFNQFNSALLFATSLINGGSARNVLINLGSNWTKHVDYTSSAAVSASDAAAAIIVGKSDKKELFMMTDLQVEVDSADYSCMSNSGDALGQMTTDTPYLMDTKLYTTPYFHLTEQGIDVFNQFGMNAPIRVVKALLERNNIDSKDVTLISHQASTVLMDFWENGDDTTDGIHPGQYIRTIYDYANMTLATLGVNITMEYDQIQHDNLILLGVGLEQKTTASLLKRNN